MLIIFAMVACFLLGAIFFSSHCSTLGGYESARKAYIVFCGIVLGLQSGLRDVAVGPDTVQYLHRFEVVQNEPWNIIFSAIEDYYLHGNVGGYKDPTYDFFEKVFQIPGFDYRAWLLFVALIFFAAFGNFLYKNTNRISDACFALVLYMIIYYGFYSVTGIRQTLAMALCLVAFEFAKRRKIVPFVVLVLLASSIHKSALLFLPSYLLIDFKKPKTLIGLSLILLPVLFAFRSNIVTTFGSVLGYEDYTTPYASSGAYGYSVCALIAAVLVWLKAAEIVRDNREMRSYISLFSISIMIIPALWIDPSIMRVVQYYSIFILIVFPAVLRALEPMDCRVTKSAYKTSNDSLGGGVNVTERTGHLYFLCMLFLLAYCCLRFYGYQYSFFFAGMVF